MSLPCAADYGKSTACCGQPGDNISTRNQCPATAPICSNYVQDHAWGTCSSTPLTNAEFNNEHKQLLEEKRQACRIRRHTFERPLDPESWEDLSQSGSARRVPPDICDNFRSGVALLWCLHAHSLTHHTVSA